VSSSCRATVAEKHNVDCWKAREDGRTSPEDNTLRFVRAEGDAQECGCREALLPTADLSTIDGRLEAVVAAADSLVLSLAFNLTPVTRLDIQGLDPGPEKVRNKAVDDQTSQKATLTRAFVHG
jgi:hypothetical protein